MLRDKFFLGISGRLGCCIAAGCLAWTLGGCAGGVDGGNGNGTTPANENGTATNDNGTATNDNSGTEPPPKPIITTVVGSGVAGFTGETGAALELALYLPQDVTVGPDGLLYVVDWNNHRVRRLNADGQVETLLGTGQIGDAPDGDALYTAMNHPTNVTFDNEGRLVVAAWHNSKVKRLNPETGALDNVAGTGMRSFSGDDGDANMAALDLPSSCAFNAAGELFISDQANQRIRVVDTTGIITTYCGDGTAAYGGDGGPAAMAQLNSPVGQAAAPAGRLVIDSRDRIFLADTANHVIRMIEVDGTITTVAGNNAAGAGFSGDGGAAIAAQLNTPSDVAIGPDGSIYIADTFSNRIRKVDPDGIITTIAGAGEAGYEGDGLAADEALLDRPYGVDVGPDGVVYIADTHNHRVRRITSTLPSDFDPNAPPPDDTVEQVPCTDVVGSICTWAGTSLQGFNGDGRDRLQSALYWPYDMEFTPSGRTYVLDWNNHRVRELLANNTFLTIMGNDFVGDGPPDRSDLVLPGGPGEMLGAPGEEVTLNHPTDLIELRDGRLVVVCWHNHKLRLLDPRTGLVTIIAGRGAGFDGDFGPVGDPLVRFNQVAHGVLDEAGNLFLVDQRNQRIRMVNNFAADLGDATIQTVAGSGVKGFNEDGLALLDTQFNFPAGSNPEPTGGLAMDANGDFYLSDTLNHRIRKITIDRETLEGTVMTIAGTGTAADSGDGGLAIEAEINFPVDLEIGPDGNLYFADANNNKVRMIDLTTGIITAVAGTGTRGYAGDGGAASAAQLNRPFGIAFDAAGDLYVSDTFNGRIRKVKLTD